MKTITPKQKRALGAIAVICLVLFGALILLHDELRFIDSTFNNILNGYGTLAFPIASAISFLGSIYLVPLIFIAVLGILWRKKKRRETLILAIAVLSNYAVVNIVKLLTNWPRPQDVLFSLEQTFPSTHAATPFVLYVLGYLFLVKQPKKSTFIALVGVCLLIGFSRIIVNAHWLTDVLAGILLAITWISGALLFSKK